jgi:hypothetical protein
MFAIRSWLIIMSGFFDPLVFAMGCQQKKLPKILQPKKGKGDVKQLSSMTLQTIAVTADVAEWLDQCLK